MADAFDNLLSGRAEKGAQALDSLVEQLNDDKERTIYEFLNNRGSEDVLWALVSMLSSENTRLVHYRETADLLFAYRRTLC